MKRVIHSITHYHHHYARTQAKAREQVASILGYVIKSHKYESDDSVIYSGCGPIRSDRNSDGNLSSSLLEHTCLNVKIVGFKLVASEEYIRSRN